MKLVSGELYFIGEIDVLTSERSGYYKVGLVKTSRQGDSVTRASEHQTGNPRRLDLVETVQTVAINDLESSLHHRLARQRILGEWFDFDSEQLANAIVLAKELAAEQAEHAAAARKADQLASKPSTATVGKATDEDLELLRMIRSAKSFEKRAKALEKRGIELFKSALDQGKPVDRYAGVTHKVTRSLDSKRLEAELPDMYLSFVRAVESYSKSFLPTATPKDFVPESNSEFDEFEAEFLNLVERVEQTDDLFEELHLAHLDLLGFSDRSKWDLDIAQNMLRARCGTKAGIDGVCKWTRVWSEKDKFDDLAFKAEHPEVYESFMKESTSRAFQVTPMRSYPI